MNTPDTVTPSEKLTGTNVPEFHEALKLALTRLRGGTPVVTVFRAKDDKRKFLVRTDNGMEGYDKIVKLSLTKAGAKVLADAVIRDEPKADAFEKTLRGAAIHALGYWWRKTLVFPDKKGEAFAFDPKLPPDREPTLASATPYPTGYSR